MTGLRHTQVVELLKDVAKRETDIKIIVCEVIFIFGTNHFSTFFSSTTKTVIMRIVSHSSQNLPLSVRGVTGWPYPHTFWFTAKQPLPENRVKPLVYQLLGATVIQVLFFSFQVVKNEA